MKASLQKKNPMIYRRERLRSCSVLAQWPKAHAMQWAGAMIVNGAQMGGCAIARMPLEAIGGVHLRGTLHHPVPCDLGNNRRCGNR